MSENHQESFEKTMGSSIDKDSIMNLANNLIKDENTFDMGSIMRMATNLLKDEKLLKDFGKLKQNASMNLPIVDESKLLPANKKVSAQAVAPEKVLDVQEELSNHFSAMKEEYFKQFAVIQTELSNDISAIETILANLFSAMKEEFTKQFLEIHAELTDLKVQNEKLVEQISYIQNNFKIKKKKNK
ncbi:hypothetical protein [Neobacillus cucumis]|uniref:Uncharacterized protein n=1 Tax=Neobacillus cucumis TaxID=1740721 RepID=A0A2N5HNR5_9BACI|nr:hypothetical protein [Neobacillus cucumis]PLS07154.1 hypothetical protein CVD27_05595 [Neobacillus cucumis]